VLIDGPHGVFTGVDQMAGIEGVMIAAGIPANHAPFRSLGEDLAATGRDVLILYVNRTRRRGWCFVARIA